MENFVTTQTLVDPAHIESELLRIWEELAQSRTRACLFNLIVFNRLSPRTDYIRAIVQRIIEQFPCRVLFISHEPDSPSSYLKTAVSVVPQSIEGSVACDDIDIGVAGSELPKVPFLLLPHIIPDLPVYLLWGEDPAIPHPLFEPLLQLASRLLLDSESADQLLPFANSVEALSHRISLADLNWVRTQGWRDLAASLFHSPIRVEELRHIRTLEITYNSFQTEAFCHLKIQALYLLAWLASQLRWEPAFHAGSLSFSSPSGRITASIDAARDPSLPPGAISRLALYTENGGSFVADRSGSVANVIICSREQCALPYPFVLSTQGGVGQSLATEIALQGTSSHYLQMLHALQHFPKEIL
jgi:glucose-6-phosphate dehydrogenase assembly protein OpcA